MAASTTLKAALDHAQYGREVFPAKIVDGQKKGFIAGKKNGGARWGATTDLKTIQDYWTRFPNALLGIATGAQSGIFVIDADTIDAHGADGVGTLERWIKNAGEWPDTAEALTPSGGRHSYFRCPTGFQVKTTAGVLAPGIDVRGEGGMVLAPPSIKPGAGPYKWSKPPEQFGIADAPGWLLDKIKAAQAPKPRALPSRVTVSEPVTDRNANEIRELLTYVDPDAGGYQQWLDVLMAIHEGFGDNGLALAEEWSARGAKFRPGEIADKFQSFMPGGGVGLGTIAALARQGGANLSAIAKKHRMPMPPNRRAAELEHNHAVVVSSPDEHDSKIELTEDGVALAFVQRYGQHMRFDHETKRWFVWQGDHWRCDAKGLAFNICRDLARKASATSERSLMTSARKAAFVRGVERLARADTRVAVTSEVWDSDPMLLGAPGVTVDLRTGEPRAPDPNDGITKRCAVEPEVGMCEHWNNFLMQATGGDEDVIRFIQVWMGYLLTGRTTEHVLLFLFGPGGNGKSVFLNILARLLGDYAITASMETFTATRSDPHPTGLAMLRGARMVSVSETEEGRAWAESRIKAITGGDPITARFMRGDFFTYEPQFKLTIVGNHQPVLRNVDQAFRRRFLILPFTRKPDHPDPDLEDRLWDEAPQILAWAIRGCLEWQEQGLPRPNAVSAATEEYFSDQDTFGEWVSQCCAVGTASDFATASDLYESWCHFAEAAGERPGSQKSLGGRLRRLGLSPNTKRINAKSQKVWLGISMQNRA